MVDKFFYKVLQMVSLKHLHIVRFEGKIFIKSFDDQKRN